MSGTFITFEGGEGCGKSTQLALLRGVLEAAHIPCLITREPGGSAGAEQIRALLVNGDQHAWDATTETLLFYAARLDHMNRLIRPALAAGKMVVCDRFSDSTKVYQGIGKKVPRAFIDSIHQLTLGDFAPDITIVLDIDPEEGLKRAQARSSTENRFESMGFAFHQSVRAGFLSIAKAEPERCVVVDASGTKDQVHQRVISIINQKLSLNLHPHG